MAWAVYWEDDGNEEVNHGGRRRGWCWSERLGQRPLPWHGELVRQVYDVINIASSLSSPVTFVKDQKSKQVNGITDPSPVTANNIHKDQSGSGQAAQQTKTK
ncbi:hypothetical protein SAY86_025103 [Trapa natans]|uniref:Uncharacterized protein n=1 Tax=Trapa natans TaxID=22666 RepID=A0AAN7M068_TRANT|nr:hypothetical protein SAY86_025103 [Trapa natans]